MLLLWFKHVFLFCFFIIGFTQIAKSAEHVIHISVDGLHAEAISILGRDNAPNFFRLRDGGLTTDYARTDPKFTNTLPNHTSMMTGLIVKGGHQWDINIDPGPPVTIHSSAGAYINSIFDLVNEAGMSTSLFVSKDKFEIYDRSWGEKIDRYYYNSDTQQLVSEFIVDLTKNNRNYSFLHIKDPDKVGHAESWDLNLGSPYLNSIIRVDVYLGEILDFIEATQPFMNKTAIILVADHGGEIGTRSHTSRSAQSHIIPFYLWGEGVAQNEDIYNLNKCLKPPIESINPAFLTEKPAYDDGWSYLLKRKLKKATVVYQDDAVYQPVRNGDSANVAAKLLGLEAITDSQLTNVTQFQLPAQECSK